MKKIKILILSVLISLSTVLCSCNSMIKGSGEELIKPPTLFDGQDKVTEALKKSVGEKITLEYPQRGENRSAFIFYDIDGDLHNEALAFYSSNTESAKEDVIHINVLKSNGNGDWNSMCDIVGEASTIDAVSIAEMGSKAEIIIGWELMSDREKTLVCYSLSGNTLIRDYTTTYVEFSVYDFWMNNKGEELITVNYSESDASLKTPIQNARLIALRNNEFKEISSVPLDLRVTGYKNCVAGFCDEKTPALFLDGFIDAVNVNTQILKVNSRGNLMNPLLKDGKTDDSNIHKATLLTQDIDEDGIFEVPHQEAVTGYEDVPESEQLNKTVWKKLSGSRLRISSVMYISKFGIRINIPQSLDSRITIKQFSAQNEIKFYEFRKSVAESTHELFSIRVDEKNLYEEKEGYEVLKSNDYTVITVKISDPDSEICPTMETIYKAVQIV